MNINMAECGGSYYPQNPIRKEINNGIETIEIVEKGALGLKNFLLTDNDYTEEDFKAIAELGNLAVDYLSNMSQEKEITDLDGNNDLMSVLTSAFFNTLLTQCKTKLAK